MSNVLEKKESKNIKNLTISSVTTGKIKKSEYILREDKKGASLSFPNGISAKTLADTIQKSLEI
jgi:hypothetical protein